MADNNDGKRRDDDGTSKDDNDGMGKEGKGKR
jgi:hypothetical protein